MGLQLLGNTSRKNQPEAEPPCRATPFHAKSMAFVDHAGAGNASLWNHRGWITFDCRICGRGGCRRPAAQGPPAAVAADPVLFSWTGCHVGGNVGAAISEDKTTAPATGASRSFGATGFAGGGQIGCDYQFAPRWVVGVEGRADWSSLKSIHAGQVTFFQGGSAPAQGTVVNNFLASATGRLGYSFADRWLVFARGGAAWTRERIDSAFTNLAGNPVDPSATMTRTGWTAGGGVEWAFAPQRSATLEYNYYDFGRQSVMPFTPSPSA
jgi:outer membrane immunogenic protein